MVNKMFEKDKLRLEKELKGFIFTKINFICILYMLFFRNEKRV